jgi:hypothetical protein
MEIRNTYIILNRKISSEDITWKPRCRLRGEGEIETNLKKRGVRLWTGFISIGIEFSGEVLYDYESESSDSIKSCGIS